jgi:hypothetical protein
MLTKCFLIKLYSTPIERWQNTTKQKQIKKEIKITKTNKQRQLKTCNSHLLRQPIIKKIHIIRKISNKLNLRQHR